MDDLELKNLNEFIGTERYHNVMGIKCTDGVAYIMENGYSWFVTDSIAVIITKLKNQEFLSVSLKLKNNEAQMIITNGNENVLYTQDYEYTDAKRELKLFCTNGVLMLNNEY